MLGPLSYEVPCLCQNEIEIVYLANPGPRPRYDIFGNLSARDINLHQGTEFVHIGRNSHHG